VQRIAKAAAGPEREFVALLPRGQGKTTLLAAIALHHLITVENAAVYCAASSREQARILYEAAAAFARRYEDEHVIVRHLELRWCDEPDEPNVFSRHLRVLAADAPRLPDAVAGDHRRATRAPVRRRLPRDADRDVETPGVEAARYLDGRPGR
jgi:hypothetical protein